MQGFGLDFESLFLVSKMVFYYALDFLDMLRQSLGEVHATPGRNISNSNLGVLYSTVSFSMKKLLWSCRWGKAK